MSLFGEAVDRVHGAAATSFEGRDVCSVQLELTEPIISKHWELLVDLTDHSLVALRFDHGDDPELPDELIVFDGEFTWDGMTVPRFRHWYLEDSGNYLGTDIIVKALGG